MDPAYFVYWNGTTDRQGTAPHSSGYMGPSSMAHCTIEKRGKRLYKPKDNTIPASIRKRIVTAKEVKAMLDSGYKPWQIGRHFHITSATVRSLGGLSAVQGRS
jgi:hypothetical protein